jgi:hypothetical protein
MINWLNVAGKVTEYFFVIIMWEVLRYLVNPIEEKKKGVKKK